jgi:flagellar motor protein MotB
VATKKLKEEKFIVPGWMVSFSDMIVNMMCFFILLNSYATTRESGFLGAGTGTYAELLMQEGRPGLMPSNQRLVPLDTKAGRYQAPRIDPLARENWTKHTLSAIDDEFNRLAHSHSKVEAQKRSFPIPLGLQFAAGSARLTAKHQRDLDALAPTLAAREDVLEILGACDASECNDDREAWNLSYQRANAVATHLARAGVPGARLFPIGVGTNPPDAVADERPPIARRVALRWRLAP